MSAYNDHNMFLFTGCNENKESVDFIFKNDLNKAISIASGDFNNDGFIDVLSGIPWSASDGWAPTGMVLHYISPIMVGVTNASSTKPDMFTVTPNPTTSIINVLYNTNQVNKYDITIVSITGTEVIRTVGIPNSIKTINLSKLPTGVYVISIKSNGQILNKKIIKR